KKEIKAAVINGDDPHANEFIKASAVQVLTYGVENDCDIWAKDIQLSEKGTSFSLMTPFGKSEIHMPLIGLFNVYNALAAASTSLLSSVSLEEIKTSLKSASSV